MKTEFRTRAFLPVVLPLAILAVIGLLVGLFALVLLYNTHEVALVLAVVMAAAILLTISLAASRDRLDAGRRSLLLGVVLVPLVLGGAYALGLGNVDPALLNINREPLQVVPDDAPVIVATNSIDFESDQITLPADPEDGEVVVVFDNQESGIAHNWAMYVTDTAEELIAETPEVTGPGQAPVFFEPPDPGDYYFQCDLHPNMQGTVVVEDGAEPSVGSA